MNRRNRIAVIRGQMLANVAAGEEPFDRCPHCLEAQAALNLDDVRAAYVAELSRDDCPRHRVQRIRRMLAIIDERFDLLMRPAAPGVH
jgi:hypothetical protein